MIRKQLTPFLLSAIVAGLIGSPSSGLLAHGTDTIDQKIWRAKSGLPEDGPVSDREIIILATEWATSGGLLPESLTLEEVTLEQHGEERSIYLTFDFDGDVLPSDITWETMDFAAGEIGDLMAFEGFHSVYLEIRNPDSGYFDDYGRIIPLDPTPVIAKEIDTVSVQMAKKLGKPAQRAIVRKAPVITNNRVGALTGKTVVLNQAHGWFDDVDFGRWRVQRGNCFGITEDYSSAQFLNLYVIPKLLNAGAKVQTVREMDHQTNMVIVDNADGETNPNNGVYREEGTWSTSSINGFVQKTGTAWTGVSVNPFNQGSGQNRLSSGLTTGEPTATATWVSNIPEDGYYNVYASWTAFSGRASDAQYLVHHSGGVTEVRVNQQLDGYQWNLLGNFYFEAGAPEDQRKVVLTNHSNDTGATNVSADAVRWGGGMGDVARHNHGLSNQPRWAEEAVINLQWNGFGYSPYNYTGDDDEAGGWSDRPQYARWQYDVDGGAEDLIYIGFHTNAVGNDCSGGARGFVELRHSSATADTILLGNSVYSNVYDQVESLWAPGWTSRNPSSRNLGENSVNSLGTNVPGILLEGLFHDNEEDATMYGDPQFRDDMARGMVHGIIDFFASRDSTSLTNPPETPETFRVINQGNGSVTLTWTPPKSSATDSLYGDPATSYRVYTSTNGFGFDNGIDVTGTTTVINDVPENAPLFFRVAAVNSGGESFPTETLAASTGEGNILIVNGFDRYQRSQVPGPAITNVGSSVLNVDPREFQNFNYVVEHADAIAPLGIAISSASNEAVRDGLVNLDNFSVIVWVAGEESTSTDSFDPQEQTAISNFLSTPGKGFFVSGSEVAWDIGQGGSASDISFLSNVLGASYVRDSAGTYTANGSAGGIFSGISGIDFSTDAGARYNAEYPDVIAAASGADIAMVYGNGDTAGVSLDGTSKAIYLAFPFETIADRQKRIEIMASAMDFFTVDIGPTPTATPTPIPTPDYGPFEDFESPLAETLHMFRAPTFSGSTSGISEGSALVLSGQSNPLIPTAIAPVGSQAMSVQLQWDALPDGAVRLTTFGASGRPNPRINLTKGVSFYARIVSGSEADVRLWVRETGSAGTVGGDGGSAGQIEATQYKSLRQSDGWTYLYFDLPNETWDTVTGDGSITETWGTLEAVYIRPTAGTTATMEILLDDFYNGENHFGVSLKADSWILE